MFNMHSNNFLLHLIHRQRDGKEITQSLKYKTKQSDITYGFTITKCALEDAGSYTVLAKNSFGEASHTFNVQVNRKYRFFFYQIKE